MEPKYKNIRFCNPSSNEECKELLLQHISNSKKCRPLGYVPKVISSIQNLSRPIESTVRWLFGSEKNRFILYDVIYEGTYHTKMREVDLINIKSTDTIQIGEIKFTSNKTQAIHCGSLQLQASTEILQKKFTNVKCVLIIIDLINECKIEGNRNSIFCNSKIIKKDSGFEYELIEISAFSLLQYAERNDIHIIDEEELQIATDEATENLEKRMQRKADMISEKIEKMIYGTIQEKNYYACAIRQTAPVLYNLINSSFYNNQTHI